VNSVVREAVESAPTIESIRLGSARRLTLYATLALLTVSGLVWLVMHWSRAADSLPNPLEPWSLRIHGAAAMLTLFLLGSMFHVHVLRGWRLARNRTTGACLGVGLCILAATGWGLYYLEGDVVRATIDLLHSVLGVAAPFMVWLHIARGRRLAAALRGER
jgi:hypothetical protein